MIHNNTYYIVCIIIEPIFLCNILTLKVLNFCKFTSYCSLKPLWSGMGEVVPARTSPTSPIHSHCASVVVTSTLRAYLVYVLIMKSCQYQSTAASMFVVYLLHILGWWIVLVYIVLLLINVEVLVILEQGLSLLYLLIRGLSHQVMLCLRNIALILVLQIGRKIHTKFLVLVSDLGDTNLNTRWWKLLNFFWGVRSAGVK